MLRKLPYDRNYSRYAQFKLRGMKLTKQKKSIQIKLDERFRNLIQGPPPQTGQFQTIIFPSYQSLTI